MKNRLLILSIRNLLNFGGPKVKVTCETFDLVRYKNKKSEVEFKETVGLIRI
jgi:hypothetical protein